MNLVSSLLSCFFISVSAFTTSQSSKARRKLLDKSTIVNLKEQLYNGTTTKKLNIRFKCILKYPRICKVFNKHQG